QSQVNAFLPSKGKFTFPAPWGTRAVRLTNASDCGGSDCIYPVGYSYWNNINNHAGFDTMLIMIGTNRSRGGQGPMLLQFNKKTEELTSLGPVFNSSHNLSHASGEGMYFSSTLPTKLYALSGANLLRYDVMTKQSETVFNIASKMSGHTLWQAHSSKNDRVHS